MSEEGWKCLLGLLVGGWRRLAGQGSAHRSPEICEGGYVVRGACDESEVMKRWFGCALPCAGGDGVERERERESAGNRAPLTHVRSGEHYELRV